MEAMDWNVTTFTFEYIERSLEMLTVKFDFYPYCSHAQVKQGDISI